jgi:hypothetical protein
MSTGGRFSQKMYVYDELLRITEEVETGEAELEVAAWDWVETSLGDEAYLQGGSTAFNPDREEYRVNVSAPTAASRSYRFWFEDEEPEV